MWTTPAISCAAQREPAVIFGHSLGALVAAAAAAAEPERVRAIILEDPPGTQLLTDLQATPFFTLFRQLQKFAGSVRPVAEIARHLADIELTGSTGRGSTRLGASRDAVQLRFMARCLKDVDPEVLPPLLESRLLDGFDIEAALGSVHCPVLLLQGNEKLGGMLGDAAAARWAGLLTDCTSIEFPAAGHLLHWLDITKTINMMLGFLEALR